MSKRPRDSHNPFHEKNEVVQASKRSKTHTDLKCKSVECQGLACEQNLVPYCAGSELPDILGCSRCNKESDPNALRDYYSDGNEQICESCYLKLPIENKFISVVIEHELPDDGMNYFQWYDWFMRVKKGEGTIWCYECEKHICLECFNEDEDSCIDCKNK